MKDKKGFSLIDIIVALAIIALLFLSVYEMFLLSTRATYTRIRKVEATLLAKEGIEATRTLRNESWTDNIVTLSDGTSYYLVLSAGKWTLSSSSSTINNLFTRIVVLDSVYRDASDNISTSGTLDPDTKKVTATISWQERGKAHEIILATYLTNFLDN